MWLTVKTNRQTDTGWNDHATNQLTRYNTCTHNGRSSLSSPLLGHVMLCRKLRYGPLHEPVFSGPAVSSHFHPSDGICDFTCFQSVLPYIWVFVFIFQFNQIIAHVLRANIFSSVYIHTTPPPTWTTAYVRVSDLWVSGWIFEGWEAIC